MTERIIRPQHAPRELPGLVESLTVGELLAPSAQIVWCAPQMGDAPLVDNRSNAYASLEPTWPRAKIRFSQLASTLITRGCHLWVETLETQENRLWAKFVTSALTVPDALHVSFVDHLSTPCWATDTWALVGKARWTEAGILPEEPLRLTQDLNRVTEIRARMLPQRG